MEIVIFALAGVVVFACGTIAGIKLERRRVRSLRAARVIHDHPSRSMMVGRRHDSSKEMVPGRGWTQ